MGVYNCPPTTVTPQFKALQEYLTSTPTGLTTKAFETSIGYEISLHETNYQSPNISDTVAQLVSSTIAPFNLTSMLTIEVGSGGAESLKQTLWQEFEESEIGGLYNQNSFTEEEVEALREAMTDKMLELLGPFEALLIEIPLLSYLEDKAGDLVLGEKAEEIQKFARELELPEFLFEDFCEDL